MAGDGPRWWLDRRRHTDDERGRCTFHEPETATLPNVTVGDVNVAEVVWPASPSLRPTDAAELLV